MRITLGDSAYENESSEIIVWQNQSENLDHILWVRCVGTCSVSLATLIPKKASTEDYLFKAELC